MCTNKSSAKKQFVETYVIHLVEICARRIKPRNQNSLLLKKLCDAYMWCFQINFLYVTCLHCTKQNNMYNHCAQDRIRASNHIPAETYCNCIQCSIFLVWIRLVHEPHISCAVWSIFCRSCSHPKSKKNSIVTKELLSYPTLNYIGLVYYGHYKHYKIISQRRVFWYS